MTVHQVHEAHKVYNGAASVSCANANYTVPDVRRISRKADINVFKCNVEGYQSWFRRMPSPNSAGRFITVYARRNTPYHFGKTLAAAGSQGAEEAEVGSEKPRTLEKPRKTNLASTGYIQTYVIMKPTGTAAFGTNGAYRDVLFR